MTAPRACWKLPTRHLGQTVQVYACVDSTNRLAAEASRECERPEESAHGLAFLADEQSAGRGQHGRIWVAPPGASVLLSILLFPPEALRRPAVLTAWAAVSVCSTIQKLTGVQARIKWPNDVLLHGRKVCGILIEQSRGIVAGIGLNVQQSAADFAQAGLPDATSLSQHASQALVTEEVARTLLLTLDEEYDHVCHGDLAGLEACWKWHLGLLGRQVIAYCHDGSHRGRLLEVGFAGIEIDRPGQGILELRPELIHHLSPA
jgi:BirA family biotin operon repressor/biotin-[acetyl-CoA-carboxylase] ligase